MFVVIFKQKSVSVITHSIAGMKLRALWGGGLNLVYREVFFYACQRWAKVWFTMITFGPTLIHLYFVVSLLASLLKDYRPYIFLY